MAARVPWTALAGWLLLALLMAVPAMVRSRYILYLGTLLALNAALATSLNLIIGYTGQFALSHSAFYGVGAYASALLITRGDVSFWVSLPIAAAVVGVLALLIGYPSLRYTGGVHFALITFAFGELIRLVAANWHTLTGGPQGLRILYSPEPAFGLDFSSYRGMYFLAAAALALSLVVVAVTRRSRLGRALLAVREDEVLADSLGINVTGYKIIAFVLSSVVAGITGAIYAPFMGFISPELLNASESVSMVGMLIVGGIGTLSGPVIGTVVFMAVPEILRVAKFYRLVILGVVIVFAVLFMPDGITGLARRRFRRHRRLGELESVQARALKTLSAPHFMMGPR